MSEQESDSFNGENQLVVGNYYEIGRSFGSGIALFCYIFIGFSNNWKKTEFSFFFKDLLVSYSLESI
jgi:hypothetical protein